MDRTDRRIWLACSAVSLAVAGLLVVRDARAQTFGVHLLTAHADADARDDNQGLYVILPFGLAEGRVIAGGYLNSINSPARRTSYYLGQAWQWGRFGIVAAVVSGYTKERVDCPCPAGSSFATCWQEFGFSNNRLLPVLVPSVSWPEARKYIGVVPRLSLLGNRGVHLSIEAPL